MLWAISPDDDPPFAAILGAEEATMKKEMRWKLPLTL